MLKVCVGFDALNEPRVTYTTAMSDDKIHMKRAIRLAKRGAGYVEPNPMVGCVIVRPRTGQVLGEGWHRKFGGPHAEVNALGQAGGRAKGATAYVTLEPCSHTGKTEPCAEALIAAKVKRVVIGARDPNPTGAGGAAKLRRAGIDVTLGVCEDEATQLIAPFTKVVSRGLPYVLCKWAQTIDGKIAARTGDSQWISSPQSRAIVHRLRARADAVMVGIGTAIADDPSLTARDTKIRRIARRVVVDPTLRLPLKSKLVATVDDAPVTVVTGKTAVRGASAKRLRAKGVEVVGAPLLSRKRLDLAVGLSHLVDTHGVTNIIAEGGAGLTGSLIEQQLADELLVFIGPRVLGDAAGINSVDTGRAVPTIDAGVAAHLIDSRTVGPDVMLRYRLCGL